MASLTRWTWVWEDSRSWWWTGRPGVTERLNCTDWMVVISFYLGCPFSHSAYNLSKTVRHGADPFSAQRWVCVPEWMCDTENSLLEFWRGAQERVQTGSPVGGWEEVWKDYPQPPLPATLELPNPSHQFQCVAPGSLLTLVPSPLFITSDLTFSRSITILLPNPALDIPISDRGPISTRC